MGYYNTFVVKIWCTDCGEMIRGHIQHVGSQEYAYFLNNQNMTDFMASHLTPSPSELSGGGKPGDGSKVFSDYLGDVDD